MIINESNIHEITENIKKLAYYMNFIRIDEYLPKLLYPHVEYMKKYYTIVDKQYFFHDSDFQYNISNIVVFSRLIYTTQSLSLVFNVL
jgi:hypothetical protein